MTVDYINYNETRVMVVINKTDSSTYQVFWFKENDPGAKYIWDIILSSKKSGKPMSIGANLDDVFTFEGADKTCRILSIRDY